MTDHRKKIEASLKAFATSPLRQASLDLLATLGYRSDKTIAIEGSKPGAFLDFIAENNPDSGFDQKKALFSEWKSADLLFQLTDEEISREATLFQDATVKPSLLRSYLFFAIELTGGDYARGKLTAIARQINRVFPMPVMVLIRHGGSDNPVGVAKQCSSDNPVGVAKQCSSDNPVGVSSRDKIVSATLSIAVINRRQNKVRSDKDVLGKVTIIRDISLASPHRGHLDILDSFAIDNLQHSAFSLHPSFDTLHSAWEEVFNVELLNKRFYRELANWYFWALPQVEFPADLEPDAEKRRATGLIRLLTRLIFCWFLKEKNLIPEKLFHPADLDKILNGFDPESETSSVYYQAILQNLFFATLNQRMGKDSNGKPYRKFAFDEGFPKNRATYDVNNLYRYENLFTVSENDALSLFADIPFLNGGLFECLDQSSSDNPVGVSPKKLYLDGFSRNAKKRPQVPDRLFFDSGETADLSEVYGDKKRKSEKVTGLITILNRYKFTIVENTPIDQEIALDPELLGKVFENLLATYNEETKTTARKQTGSFYTPRPIVEYMVDESLKAYLEHKVAETILSRSSRENVAEFRSQENANDPILSRSFSQESEAGLPLLPYNPEAPTTITRANLPHWSQNGTTYWITFRLADSLPQEKLNAWKSERDIWMRLHPEPWDENQWKEYDDLFGKRLENWLDAGSGGCHLRNPEVRAIVEKCLNHYDGDRYHLGPWVIMPNHVHLLLRPHDGQSLSKILKGIKGVSARECNALLGRTGQSFWQEESYDHIVRSQAQFDRFVRYIVENPVKAKLREGEYQSSRGNPAPVSQSSSDNPAPVNQSNSDNPVGVARQCSSDNPVGVHPDNTETRLSRLPSLRSRLDNLFSYTEEPHQFSDAEVDTLITAIDEIKILDPACGSGAFPMGVLHKLVYILGKLDPDNERWKQTQLAKLDSAPMREELERAFADNNDDYGRKLYLIENCLYGVDIQPIAIQITKLRFFISLVCDQKIKSSSDNPVGVAKQSSSDNPVGVHSSNTETRLSRLRSINLGIRPLPNLETKFVAANTLIGLPIPEPDLFIRTMIEPIEKEIEQAYHSHFAIQRRDQKLALQKRIKTLRQKLADTIVNGLGASKDSEIIKKAQHVAEWDPFDPQSSADFFDPHWMFGQSLKDGFDLVIGNPPYVQIQKFPAAQKAKWEAQKFATYAATADIYCLFYERGTQFLRTGGHLCYITSNKWMRAGYGEKMRAFFVKQTRPRQVIDFGGVIVFNSATVDSVIVLTAKGSTPAPCSSIVLGLDYRFSESLEEYIKTRKVSFPLPSDGSSSWVVLSPQRYSIKSQVEAQGVPLERWKIQINYGIKTGFNDAFYLTQEQREAFITEDPRCTEFLVPLMRGRHIERYRSNWDGTWMIATFPSYNLKVSQLPKSILQHLESYHIMLEPKPHGWKGTKWDGRKAGTYQWFETQDSISYSAEFSKPKIIYPNMTKYLPFYLDTDTGYFTNDKGFIISSQTESLQYLTAFLNSHLFRCCFIDNFPNLGEDRRELRKIFMDKIPVKKPTAAEVNLFDRLVPLVQFAKSGRNKPVADSFHNRDRIVSATFLEDLIDACVMECYFREHMAERNLLFIDDLAPYLSGYDPKASETKQRDFLAHLYATLNAPSHPIRNQLIRLTADSPDLLAVIKAEGKV